MGCGGRKQSWNNFVCQEGKIVCDLVLKSWVFCLEMAFTFTWNLGTVWQFFSSRHSGIGLVGSPVNPMARRVSLYYLELSFCFFLTTARAFRAFIWVFSRTQVRFTTFFIFRYLSIAITCGPSSVLLAVGNPLNLYKMLHCPLVEENGNFLPITTCCSLTHLVKVDNLPWHTWWFLMAYFCGAAQWFGNSVL